MSCCQSRLSRAKRETSRAQTAPTSTEANFRHHPLKPARCTRPAAERPRTSSITSIYDQPSAMSRSAWRIVVGCSHDCAMLVGAEDWRTSSPRSVCEACSARRQNHPYRRHHEMQTQRPNHRMMPNKELRGERFFGRSQTSVYNATRPHSQSDGRRPPSSPSAAIHDGIWRCAMPKAPRQPPSLNSPTGQIQLPGRTYDWIKIG